MSPKAFRISADEVEHSGCQSGGIISNPEPKAVQWTKVILKAREVDISFPDEGGGISTSFFLLQRAIIQRRETLIYGNYLLNKSNYNQQNEKINNYQNRRNPYRYFPSLWSFPVCKEQTGTFWKCRHVISIKFLIDMDKSNKQLIVTAIPRNSSCRLIFFDRKKVEPKVSFWNVC